MERSQLCECPWRCLQHSSLGFRRLGFVRFHGLGFRLLGFIRFYGLGFSRIVSLTDCFPQTCGVGHLPELDWRRGGEHVLRWSVGFSSFGSCFLGPLGPVCRLYPSVLTGSFCVRLPTRPRKPQTYGILKGGMFKRSNWALEYHTPILFS